MLFDLHTHSKYSVADSRCEVGDMLDRAKELGLAGIAVTDHNAIKGTLEALELAREGRFNDLVVVPGIEVSSLDGHILCLGIKEIIERDLSAEETVRKAHDLGGIAIAAHPYDKFRDGVGELCFKLDFDAVEINGHCLWGNSLAAKMAKKHKKPLTGGSDAHSISGIGTIVTKADAQSVDGLLSTIKAGRCSAVRTKNVVPHKARMLVDKVARTYGRTRRL